MALGARSARITLLLVGLLALLAWRLETPWRRLQAEYLDGVLERSRAELAVLRVESAEDLRFLEGEVEVARGRLPAREIADEERRLVALERRLLRAEPGREAEGLEELVDGQRRTLDELLSELRAAEDQLADARRPMERLEARVASLDGLGGWLRRVPVLRALGAGIGLRESTPTGTGPGVGIGTDTDTGTVRPERCVTCHLSMAPDAAPSVVPVRDARLSRLFAPHSLPDLHVAPASAHPVDEFGCTACHGGDGAATSFAEAGHRARDQVTAASSQAASSQAPRPILAGSRVEASCVACHDGWWLPSAPTQDAGRLLARSMACAACHETGRPDLEPTVPSLVGLPLRKRRAWVASFLADPSSWKPTFMPHFWDDAEPAERAAEIAAVVAWLWRSAPNASEEMDGTRDSSLEAEGRRLWQSIGCAACHLVEEARRDDLLGSQRLRGPSLAAFGVEARPVAVLNVLRSHDPAYVWRDGEVEALAVYLSGLVGKAASTPPNLDRRLDRKEALPEVRDDLLLRRLQEVTTREDAAAWMDRLEGEARSQLLGRLAVRRYRCGSCHALPEASPVGPPLPPASTEATSLVEVGERLRDSSGGWPSEELASWPHAETRDVLPTWRLIPAEVEALAVQLAGWREGSLDRQGVSPGRAVMARHGCRACHALTAGDERVGIFDARPLPSLVGSGEKLRSEWIFRHLGDPDATALRPWAGLRMPRFDLTPADRSAVAVYLARRDSVPVLSPEVGLPTASERALGDAIYRVLLCDRCHGAGVAARAPDYRVAGRRLRAPWLQGWLLRPPEGVHMPAPFPLRGGRPDASYLLATLDAPMFEVNRTRLERFFPDRDELERIFDDPEAVADALALHVLTLGEQ